MSDFPSFHKRNVDKVSFPSFHKRNIEQPIIVEEQLILEEQKVKIEYPLNHIPGTDGNVSYSKFNKYTELFSRGFYKEVINLLLPKEGGGAGLIAIMTLTLGPVGFFAGRSIANEDNRYINFVIANCYYKLGDYKNALKHLDKITYWSWAKVYFLRAWTLYKLDEVESSKTYFRKAFLNNPDLMDYPCPVEVSI